MGVNIFNSQEKKYFLQNKVGKIKENLFEKKQEVFHQWQENIRKFVNIFLNLFGKNGESVSNYFYCDIYFDNILN